MHSHRASCSTVGNHSHTYPVTTNSGGGQSTEWAGHTGSDWPTSGSGEHTHTISINATGGNQRHENRPPYTVINRWKRTA